MLWVPTLCGKWTLVKSPFLLLVLLSSTQRTACMLALTAACCAALSPLMGPAIRTPPGAICPCGPIIDTMEDWNPCPCSKKHRKSLTTAPQGRAHHLAASVTVTPSSTLWKTGTHVPVACTHHRHVFHHQCFQTEDPSPVPSATPAPITDSTED